MSAGLAVDVGRPAPAALFAPLEEFIHCDSQVVLGLGQGFGVLGGLTVFADLLLDEFMLEERNVSMTLRHRAS